MLPLLALAEDGQFPAVEVNVRPAQSLLAGTIVVEVAEDLGAMNAGEGEYGHKTQVAQRTKRAGDAAFLQLLVDALGDVVK